MTNFIAISQTIAKIWQFFYFQKWLPLPSCIFKMSKFLRSYGQECQTVSSCQISWRSVQTAAEKCQFVRFFKIAAAILDFLNFQILTVGMVWGQTASPCQISCSVKPLLRYGNFSIFPRWWPSAILNLWCECLNDPRRAFGGLYHCAEFGCNRCSTLDNKQVLIFYNLGLKTPTHATKLEFLGAK